MEGGKQFTEGSTLHLFLVGAPKRYDRPHKEGQGVSYRRGDHLPLQKRQTESISDQH